MCDKAALIGDTIKGTSVSIYLFIYFYDVWKTKHMVMARDQNAG